jgi:hypothetical protein
MVGALLLFVKNGDGGPNCLLLRASYPTRFLLHTQLGKSVRSF